MSSELGPAHWAGREIQARDYFYFYKGLSETLQQERAQLKELGFVTENFLFKFGVATRFGNAMGERWQFTPEHLIEMAMEVREYRIVKEDIIKDEDGKPHPTHPYGAKLLNSYLERLEELFAVSAYRAFGGDTIHKWMRPPEEQIKQQRSNIWEKLFGDDGGEPE